MSPLREPVGHCVALSRKPAYSPLQHRANDTAILNAVVAALQSRGWQVSCCTETQVESEPLPPADLYLNMCQGAAASERLALLEDGGATFINPPAGVLSCHRHWLAPMLATSAIPFPPTLIIPTHLSPEAAVALAAFLAGQRSVWLKRGDVHAEVLEDVVLTPGDLVGPAIARFAARGIRRVAVQEHVRGPVVKFYGVADRSFFRFYDARWGAEGPAPVVDEARLCAVAFGAAERLGLDVFGGDVVLRAPDDPVLIDFNDWPSFAPYRAEAAEAIAAFADAHARPGVPA